LINLLGLAGASNATGDDQKKLDVLGNQIFLDTMKNCGKVAVIVSEEEDEAIIVKTKGARYAVVCDPIDGTVPPILLQIVSAFVFCALFSELN
jgi:fructose-1,6-bisphosphatase I